MHENKHWTQKQYLTKMCVSMFTHTHKEEWQNVGRNINRDHVQSIRDGHSQAHPHTQYQLNVFLVVVYH